MNAHGLVNLAAQQYVFCLSVFQVRVLVHNRTAGTHEFIPRHQYEYKVQVRGTSGGWMTNVSECVVFLFENTTRSHIQQAGGFLLVRERCVFRGCNLL